MKKVLIVSPRFPPVNAADHHRIRVALPHFRDFGWEPVVLAVKPEYVKASMDPLLLKTVPDDIHVESVDAISTNISRFLGIGSLTLRSKRQLNAAGAKLLQNKDVDLVYFSTTEFGVLPLGREWQRRFDVPYAVDLQDPWVNNYYKDNGLRPPGGRIKHGIAQKIASLQEPSTLRDAAQITVVSDGYTKRLTSRYSDLKSERFTTLPFCFSKRDFEVVQSAGVNQDQFDKNDGKQHWVYIGRCGPDMQRSLSGLMKAFRAALDQDPEQYSNIRMHFIGTDYAPPGQERYWVRPFSEQCGLQEFVSERPLRIGYFEALKCLLDSDALIVPGSEDPTYTASKIYPLIAAGKPLLTVFDERSSVNQVMRETNAGVAVTFSDTDTDVDVSQKILKQWFLNGSYGVASEVDQAGFQPYTSQAMTRTLVKVFENACSQA